MPGYEPLAHLGYGAYMLLKLSTEGLTGLRQVDGGSFTPYQDDDAEWILAGQLSRRLAMDTDLQLYDVTAAGDDWKSYSPGPLGVTFGVHLYFNPDLMNQSLGGDAMAQKASLMHMLRERQAREFRIYTKPPGQVAHASFDFTAYIARSHIEIPDGDLMTIDLTLQVTGPVTSSRASQRNILQGLDDHDLEAGT